MPAPGAFSYDILETTGNSPPTGVCNCAVATAQTGQAYNVTTNTLGAYTVTGVLPSDYTITAQDVQSALGKSALTFTLANGVVIGSLDTGGILNVNGCNGCGGGGSLPSGPANEFIATPYGASGVSGLRIIGPNDLAPSLVSLLRSGAQPRTALPRQPQRFLLCLLPATLARPTFQSWICATTTLWAICLICRDAA